MMETWLHQCLMLDIILIENSRGKYGCKPGTKSQFQLYTVVENAGSYKRRKYELI